FTIRDRDDWNAYENGFGLTRLDGSAKPALGALRETNTWLHTLVGRRTRVVALAPLADAAVRQQHPTATAGSSTTLSVDARETDDVASTRVTSYLRFSLPALAAGESVDAATLGLHVTDPTVDGPEVWTTATSWRESTTTWRSGRPARRGTSPVADFGETPVGRVTVPVPALPASGEVSFELHAASADRLRFASREAPAAQRPQLTLLIRS
ncbi:DNRLRE domain-containing protein, partial [Kineococcus indalonis]|uniref:DNRLRE domain-containing protein n=1 Tax=Kineococcus indalonis TaxID=2696566 RepID=UPI00141213E5